MTFPKFDLGMGWFRYLRGGFWLEAALRAKYIPLVLAFLFTFQAIALFNVWRDSEVTLFIDWLWPHVFGLGGALTLAFYFKPHIYRLLTASGGVVIVGLLSRAWANFAGLFVDGPTNRPVQLLLGTVVWTGYAFLAAVVWRKVLLPYHQLELVIREEEEIDVGG